MDVRDLRLFLVLADELSISRAAARAFVAQPTLSRILRRLEGEVGTVLFDRRARALTPAGAGFLSGAAGIVDAFDRAAAEARAIATDQAGAFARADELRVGVLFPAAAELTRPILRAYRAAVPDVELRLVDLTGRGGEQALLEGQVDTAFLWTPVTVERLTVVPLFHDRLVALVADTHPLAGRTSVAVPDLAGEPYTVTATMSSSWRSASMLQPWTHAPERAVPVRDVRDALRTIAESRAVSIGPASLRRYAPTTTGLAYPFLDHLGRPTSVACCRAGDRRPHVRGFTDIAREVSAHLPGLVPDAARPSW